MSSVAMSNALAQHLIITGYYLLYKIFCAHSKLSVQTRPVYYVCGLDI